MRAAAPFRPAPKAPDETIVWPQDWGTRFIVTVDVEEEFDWSAPFDRRNRSTLAMRAFPAAHRRFADAGVPLVCLVDHPIAVDPEAVAILRDVVADGRSAIGAQLHPWVSPPFEEPLEPWASFAGNLPAELEAAKLDVLTVAITAAWNEQPLIYRAGRYGIGRQTLGLLSARGYRVDSSMRARYSYSPDGPDFTGIGPHAFRRDGLIELPLTSILTGAWPDAMLYRMLGRVPRARGAAARTGIVERIALTPEGIALREVLTAIDVAVREGVGLLTFSFHSPSLVPGHTPYVRNAADRRAFDMWWDGVLNHLEQRGIRAATLVEVIAAADGQSG